MEQPRTVPQRTRYLLSVAVQMVFIVVRENDRHAGIAVAEWVYYTSLSMGNEKQNNKRTTYKLKLLLLFAFLLC